MPSTIRTSVACKIKNETLIILVARAKRKRMTLSAYLARKLDYDATRPH